MSTAFLTIVIVYLIVVVIVVVSDNKRNVGLLAELTKEAETMYAKYYTLRIYQLLKCGKEHAAIVTFNNARANGFAEGELRSIAKFYGVEKEIFDNEKFQSN